MGLNRIEVSNDSVHLGEPTRELNLPREYKLCIVIACFHGHYIALRERPGIDRFSKIPEEKFSVEGTVSREGKGFAKLKKRVLKEAKRRNINGNTIGNL